MPVPTSGLFDVFFSTFSDLIQSFLKNQVSFVCVEHQTGWPIVAASDKATANVALLFLKRTLSNVCVFGIDGM